MEKLRYVDRVARRLRDVEPARPSGRTDITVEEMDTTVAEFYRRSAEEERSTMELPLDTDLVDIFPASIRRKRGVRPASDLLKEARKPLVDKITYWTGVKRSLVKALVESIETRVGELGLAAEVKQEKEHLAEITAYATTLAMNYLARGKFTQA